MNNQLIEPVILVVEDDLDTSKMLSYLLKSIGFKRVLVAQDGIEALNIISNTKGIICIVSDWNMPRMSGMDLFEHFKKEPLSRKIPFLMITTEAHKEKVEAAALAGVSDFVVKPFNSEVIEGKLRRMLGEKYPVH